MGNPGLTREGRDPTPVVFSVDMPGTIYTPGQQDKYLFTLPANTLAAVTFVSPLPGDIICVIALSLGPNAQGGVPGAPIGSSVHHGDGSSNNIQAKSDDLNVFLTISGHNDATSPNPYTLRIDPLS